MVKRYRTGKIVKGWNGIPTITYGFTFGNEITTEQFRKYVLKKQDENTSKFINDKTVINKEGEVFKVGDIIKSINSNLKDKIIDFRWKNDKSEICAVLPNIPNGIGIDKIELYVEPKVKPKNYHASLNSIKHIKQPLFTTEDGVDIFESDEFYNTWDLKIPNKEIAVSRKKDFYNEKPVNKHCIYFSTKEAAEEYILMHKPCLSLKEVLEIVPF